MLSADFRLRKKTDIDRVWKKGRSFATPLFSLKIAKNDLPVSRFAVVIGTKVNKRAVVRNLAKRRLREAIRLLGPRIVAGQDVIVMGRGKIADTTYDEISRTIRFAFEKSGLLKNV
ncbi:ribonuclease P protein component [Patescibacteria group bacterium]|nr:MAG: ribonuclease P protein component [Patescibacteria group bacterium]